MATIITNEEKENIRKQLREYVNRFPSQNRAAKSLKGISAGTVSQILAGKDELIGDGMWRNLQIQVCTSTSDWQYTETTAFKDIYYALDDAQKYQNVTWIVSPAGSGKSKTAQIYTREISNVFVILCSEDMRKSDFIREIASRVGIKTDDMRLRESLSATINALIQMQSPLLVFDEADKLSDPVFAYFINLYNHLEDECGIAFMSTSYMEHRMDLGLRYNKRGYAEMNSRIGRKFFEVSLNSANDVYSLCVANGITERGQIAEVIKDVENYDFDLRRAKRAIHRVKRMTQV